MRRIVLGLLCATVLSSSGFAADLPVYKAPAATYAPAFSWTGFYLGANLGYGWGKASGTSTIAGNIFGANGVFPGSSNLNGINGGGQAGYNWQTGPVVLGIEGDFQGSDQKQTTVAGCGIGCTMHVDRVGLQAELGSVRENGLYLVQMDDCGAECCLLSDR